MAVASAASLFSSPFPSSSSQPHRRHRRPDAIALRPFSISAPNFPLQLPFSLNSSPVSRRRRFAAEASVGDSESGGSTPVSDDGGFVGEDAAAFDLSEQKLASWAYFTVILGVVLFVLNVVWIDNSAGGVGKAFVDAVSGLSDSHEVPFSFTSFPLIIFFLFGVLEHAEDCIQMIPLPILRDWLFSSGKYHYVILSPFGVETVFIVILLLYVWCTSERERLSYSEMICNGWFWLKPMGVCSWVNWLPFSLLSLLGVLKVSCC